MNYWNSPLIIGNRSFGRFIGSALDGVTNLPFRKTARLFSPDALMYTEIRHCNMVINCKPSIWGIEPKEPNINFQLTTANESCVAAACERVIAQGIGMVDINIGCPASVVVRKGAGSALMADIPRLTAIIKEFRAHLPGILTVKMRAGFKEDNALEVAQLLEGLGVDALCVHPRLQTQKFSGTPNYPLVGTIKKQVKIPVLVSGGIKSFADAKNVYEITGVDGFLIGRALMGHPWLLAQLTAESQGNTWQLTSDQVRDTMAKHFDATIACFGKRRGTANFKKHLKVYLEQLGVEKELATTVLSTTDEEQFKQLFCNLF